MGIKADLMKKQIIECARQEFLAVGFHDASLREIASAAGVTTGAIYRYFKDKQALFSEITNDTVNALISKYSTMLEAAMLEADKGVSYNHSRSMANIAELYNLVYEHFDEVYLLIMRSDGKEVASFLHKFVEMEEQAVLLYFKKLTKHEKTKFQLDYIAMHFIIEAYISALFEPIRHRMDKEDAIYHAQKMSEYLAIGWTGIEKKLLNF